MQNPRRSFDVGNELQRDEMMSRREMRSAMPTEAEDDYAALTGAKSNTRRCNLIARGDHLVVDAVSLQHDEFGVAVTSNTSLAGKRDSETMGHLVASRLVHADLWARRNHKKRIC